MTTARREPAKRRVLSRTALSTNVAIGADVHVSLGETANVRVAVQVVRDVTGGEGPTDATLSGELLFTCTRTTGDAVTLSPAAPEITGSALTVKAATTSTGFRLTLTDEDTLAGGTLVTTVECVVDKYLCTLGN